MGEDQSEHQVAVEPEVVGNAVGVNLGDVPVEADVGVGDEAMK